jgi:NAD(P)H-dependent FMN reductase
MVSDAPNPMIPVLLGSRRVGRRSERVARFLLHGLSAREGIDTELIDLAVVDLPILRERVEETENPPPSFPSFHDKIAAADGLVIVSPEYKGGYPGVLKNALDHLEAGIFRRKPIGIVTVSSGAFGGLSCLAQLRLVCLAMGGVPIPEVFPVSSVDSVFDEAGNPLDPRLESRRRQFLDELLWYTRALASPRNCESAHGVKH